MWGERSHLTDSWINDHSSYANKAPNKGGLMHVTTAQTELHDFPPKRFCIMDLSRLTFVIIDIAYVVLECLLIVAAINFKVARLMIPLTIHRDIHVLPELVDYFFHKKIAFWIFFSFFLFSSLFCWTYGVVLHVGCLRFPLFYIFSFFLCWIDKLRSPPVVVPYCSVFSVRLYGKLFSASPFFPTNKITGRERVVETLIKQNALAK